MKQLVGFQNGTGRVCRLICGLKQGENIWKHDLHSTILNFGYTHQQSVYCAYNLRDEEEFSIIVVWGDVMVGIANTKETNDKFVEKLAANYKIKVIGEQHMLLVMHITPNYKNHTIQLSQSHYIHQILMSLVWKM